MVTSIVELPDFMCPYGETYASDHYCHGYMCCQTGDNDCYLPMDILLSEGRNLTIEKDFKKYKLCIQTADHPSPIYLFVICQDDICLVTGKSTGETLIFPIYANLGGGSVVLNTDAISDFFEVTSMASPFNSSRVISTQRFMAEIMHVIDPDNANRDVDIRFSPLSRNESIIELIGALTGAVTPMTSVPYLRKYNVACKNLPVELKYLFDARDDAALIPLFNKYSNACNEMVEAARRSKFNWPSINDVLHASKVIFTQSTDNILPCTPEDISRMGTLITALYEVPMDDFWFDIRTDPRDVSDMYYNAINVRGGFTRSVRYLKGWDRLMTSAVEALDLLGKFRSLSLCAHRTCMEELVIYAKADLNNPLLYIDMVWWTLASAPGLINADNTAFF